MSKAHSYQDLYRKYQENLEKLENNILMNVFFTCLKIRENGHKKTASLARTVQDKIISISGNK